MNKYRSKKTAVDGVVFDSRAESKRYRELKMMAKNGYIENLRLQVPFELVPKQKDERAVVYKADFVYVERGQTIAEDVKGVTTRDYIIKRKLFKLLYPDIKFVEVKR